MTICFTGPRGARRNTAGAAAVVQNQVPRLSVGSDCVSAQLWPQYERIIKPHGAILLFGQGAFTAAMIMSNQTKSPG